MNTNYQVVIKGVGPGFVREDVAKKLAPLFKISVDEAGQMLDQHDLVVKKGVDFQAAVKYVEALENCGCACEAQPEVTHTTEITDAAQPLPDSQSERFESVQEISTPTLEDSSESTHEQVGLTSNRWVASESSQEQRRIPLAEKFTRSKLIAIGAAVLITAGVAAAGYSLLRGEASRTPSVVEKKSVTTPVVAKTLEIAEQQNSGTIEDGDYVHESQTVAGVVTINDGGELLLNGKLVYSDEFSKLGIWKAFNFPDKTVLLLYKGGMGTSCPALYMFLTVKRDGQVAYTEDFGSCSDLFAATVDSKSIVVTIPDISGGGDESWRYADEALSQIKYIDPSIKKNADQIEVADGPVRVRGTLVRTADNQGWELKLTRTTIFLGCTPHNPLIDSLPIDPGATIPDVQGESEFEVSLSCPNSGASISSIDIPGRARDTPVVVEPATPQQSESAAPRLSADEALACEYAKERCYEKSGARVQMCLNALRSIRGCD